MGEEKKSELDTVSYTHLDVYKRQTLTGANATLLAYANKKIEELDNRRQTISKAIAELSVETICIG